MNFLGSFSFVFLGGLTATCSLEASTPGANGALSTGAAGRKISVRMNLWQAFLNASGVFSSPNPRTSK